MSGLNQRNSVEALVRPLTDAEAVCLRCELPQCFEGHQECAYRRAMRAADLARRGGPMLGAAVAAEERASARRVARALKAVRAELSATG
jgi:hypothetical protein